jgi:hypothetical protein
MPKMSTKKKTAIRFKAMDADGVYYAYWGNTDQPIGLVKKTGREWTFKNAGRKWKSRVEAAVALWDHWLQSN